MNSFAKCGFKKYRLKLNGWQAIASLLTIMRAFGNSNSPEIPKGDSVNEDEQGFFLDQHNLFGALPKKRQFQPVYRTD
jgi:hypothetical protein